METKEKMLKSYRGFLIEKSWEESFNGKKANIIYNAFDTNGDLFDGAKTLKEIKQKIDIVLS